MWGQSDCDIFHLIDCQGWLGWSGCLACSIVKEDDFLWEPVFGEGCMSSCPPLLEPPDKLSKSSAPEAELFALRQRGFNKISWVQRGKEKGSYEVLDGVRKRQRSRLWEGGEEKGHSACPGGHEEAVGLPGGAERKQSHIVEEFHPRRICRGPELEQVALKGRRGNPGVSWDQREQRKCPGDKNFNLGCSQVDWKLVQEKCPKSQRRDIPFAVTGTQ